MATGKACHSGVGAANAHGMNDQQRSGLGLAVAGFAFLSVGAAALSLPLAEATAISLGWWWFGDRPDLATLADAALIVGSGLYLRQAGKSQQPA